MPDYPDAIYTERTTENLPGIVYDPADTKNLYSEDFQHHAEEIIAIQTILGTNPNGAYATVKAWLEALAGAITGVAWGSITGTLSSQTDLQDALDAKEDALGFTPENVANKSTTLDADKASDTKYPSVKSVYDWAVGLFHSVPAGGTADQVLTKIDGTDYNTEWRDPAGGGAPAWVLDSTLTFASESGSKSATLASSYDLVMIIYTLKNVSGGGNGQVELNLNGDASSVYSFIINNAQAAYSALTSQSKLLLTDAYGFSDSGPATFGVLYIQGKRVGNKIQVFGQTIPSGNGDSSFARGQYGASTDLTAVSVNLTKAGTGKVKIYGLNY